MIVAILRRASCRIRPATRLSRLPPQLLSATSVGTPHRRITHNHPYYRAQTAATAATSSSAHILGYNDPVPPPPSIPTALFRWTIASSILVVGTCLELPLLITWRILHNVGPTLPPLLRRFNRSVLSLSYHCRIRYCYYVLRALHVHLHIVNHNSKPLNLAQRPHLFIQCNQHSLLEPLCLHAASYIQYQLLHSQQQQQQQQQKQRIDVLSLLSTPYFFINVEYGLWPLLGWVQGLTAVWVVRQNKWQARRALDRMIHRMNPYAQLVSANHPAVLASEPCSATPSAAVDSATAAAVWPESFYVSPEGGRSSSVLLQSYRTGAAIAAISASAVMVPVIMRGVRQAMPKSEWRVRGGVCEVLFDEVIETKGLQYEDRQSLTNEIRTRYERSVAANLAQTETNTEGEQ